MINALYCVKHLDLIPHPEGGFYRETYRSEGIIAQNCLPDFAGDRNFATSIYFLLEKNNFSAFHKIKSDEVWHFYAGDSLEVIEIAPSGQIKITALGPGLEKGETFQHVVPAGHWFGSRVKEGGEFSLAGCSVAPGFDFEDFEMAARTKLISMFPQHSSIITELTKPA